MKAPTFSIVGGKGRLRNWLISFFPKSGRIYVEPFAGRGNVFFKAKQELNFQEWHLNDLRAGFFQALLDVDLKKMPQSVVSKKSWNYWRKKAEEGDPRGVVLEPEITWGGKGWMSGARLGYVAGEGKKGSHPPYHRDKFAKRAEPAKQLLSDENVKITSGPWENLDWKSYGPEDFVYLDPEYDITTSYYDKNQRVNHPHLLSMLRSASFRWALSGYETELYVKELKGFRKVSTGRNAELRGANTRQGSTVDECLWLNY